MLCLIKFLSEFYQRKLRILAQGRSETYEEAIEQYRKIFLADLRYAKKECAADECPYYSTCAIVRKDIIKILENDIGKFFDEIRNVYLLWIDSKSQEAIERLKNLLEDYQLDHFGIHVKNFDVFFKGRISAENLTKWDMFHIPFNKRYLIGNQRYSLTGQPIMYIGKSVIDIAEELEVEELENFKVSTIQIPQEMKLYDLRNNILEDVADMDIDILLGEETEYGRNKFFKIILASVCSFPRKQELKNYSFCEEYVLPQLLAQIVKNKKFDGITYQSTKKFNNALDAIEKIEQFDFFYDSEFKDNIAVFTKINEKHVYDKELYDKINISVPISVEKIELITMQELEDMKEEINQTCKEQDKITKADKIVSSFNRIYGKISYKQKPYMQTELGQLHMYHLYEVLHQILVS